MPAPTYDPLATSAFTIGGCKVWEDSAEELFQRYGNQATRKVTCYWNERLTVVNALNGGSVSTGGVYLYDTTTYPDLPTLYPSQIKTKGVTPIGVGPNGLIAYQYAQLTVDYAALEGIDAQGYAELEVGTNMITLPKSGPVLCSDEATPIDVPFQDTPGYPLVILNFCRGRKNAPSLDLAQLASIAENPISSSSFLGYKPGTVIFDGGRARKQTVIGSGTGLSVNTATGVDSGGNSVLSTTLGGPWDMEYRFLVRPAMPWDSLAFRDPSGTFSFKKVKFKNGAPFIGRSDLNQLFQ